jgi:hypothetical protein
MNKKTDKQIIKRLFFKEYQDLRKTFLKIKLNTFVFHHLYNH